MGKECQRVDVVFDVYRDASIKDVERNRRSTGQLTLQKIIPNFPIKQWTLLLSSSHNKNMIIEFLIGQWKKQLNLKKSMEKEWTKNFNFNTELNHLPSVTFCVLVNNLLSNDI